METIIAIIVTIIVIAVAILYRVGINARALQRYLESGCEGDCDQGRRCACCKNCSGKR